MNESTVATRAKQGALSLLGRQIVLFPVGVVTGIVLARLLSPAEFGAFASATFVVMSAGALLEFGLGAIVIQQPEEPTHHQLRSIFTAQLILYGSAVIIFALLAPIIATALHLGADGAWLLRAMSLHMLFGTLGTNSTLLLERRMGFSTFARLDIFNVLTDRGLTLLLAFMHFGAWSFAIASLVSMALRVAMLFAAAPWPLGFAFDRAVLARALRFGMTLQATNLTMIVRDNLNALVGGGMFGPKAVGYLNWGQNLPQTCANWLVQIVTRVAYPAFARLHDDPIERDRLLDASLRSMNLMSYPTLMVLLPLGTHIVTFLYGEAWRPGLFALDCFVVRTMCTNVTSVLTGFLNATGRAPVALRIATIWTVVEVALAFALLPSFGYNGVALAYACGPALSLTLFLLAVRGHAQISYGRVFGVPLLAGFAAASVAMAGSHTITTLAALVASLCLSAGVALLVITLCERAFLTAAFASFEVRLRRWLRQAGAEPVTVP